MFRFVCLATVAKAAYLAVTYSDCGAKHVSVSDLQPTTIKTGKTETITGTGTVDEQVISAQFTATVSALGAQLSVCSDNVSGDFAQFTGNFSGDGTSDIVCSLPMGVGKITVKALNFPLPAGTVSIPVEVTTGVLIPASPANVDVHIAATDQNGESVICLDVHTAKALEVEATGPCTSAEQSALVDPENTYNIGSKASTCGTWSYNILTGNFNHHKFNSCFSASAGISKRCAECYAATGEYGAKSCKADCILGWCRPGCLSCTAPAQVTLESCTGFTPTPADPCMFPQSSAFALVVIGFLVLLLVLLIGCLWWRGCRKRMPDAAARPLATSMQPRDAGA